MQSRWIFFLFCEDGVDGVRWTRGFADGTIDIQLANLSRNYNSHLHIPSYLPNAEGVLSGNISEYLTFDLLT